MKRLVFWLGGIILAVATGWLTGVFKAILPDVNRAAVEIIGHPTQCYIVQAVENSNNEFVHRYCFKIGAPNCGLTHTGITQKEPETSSLTSITCNESLIEFKGDRGNGYHWTNRLTFSTESMDELKGSFSDSLGNKGKIIAKKTNTSN